MTHTQTHRTVTLTAHVHRGLINGMAECYYRQYSYGMNSPTYKQAGIPACNVEVGVKDLMKCEIPYIIIL